MTSPSVAQIAKTPMKNCGSGKSCGGTCIEKSRYCRVNMPTTLRGALSKASEEVRAKELVAVAKHIGGREAEKKAKDIRRQIAAERGGNVVPGEKGREFKRRLEAAGLIPKGSAGKPIGIVAEEEKKPIGIARKPFLTPGLQKRLEEEANAQEKMPFQKVDRQKSVAKPGPVTEVQGKLEEAADKARLAALGQRGDSMNRHLEEIVILKEEKMLAELKKEREDLIGKQGPEVNKRRLELADEIGRLGIEMKDARKKQADNRKEIERLAGPGPVRQELDAANRRQQHLDMLHEAMGHGGMTREDFKGDLSALLFAARDLRNQQGDGDERLNRAINGPGADASAAPMETRLARGRARDFDAAFPRIDQVRKIGETVDWNESTGSGSKKLGQGAYGTVIKTKGGVAHKRGDVSSEEAAIIKKLGEAGVGPKLIGAEINGPGNNRQSFVDVRTGRIAMEAIEGKPLGDKSPGSHHATGKQHSTLYWETRADVHRAGIQHNDMHIENVMVGKDGKGRIVDLGLALDNPRAALAEALGAFKPPRGATSVGDGDWQVKRWDVPGLGELNQVMRGQKTYAHLETVAPALYKINENKRDVISKMRNEMGLSNDEIGEIMTRGIRKKPEVYASGAFAKITDEQAMDLINTLYAGI